MSLEESIKSLPIPLSLFSESYITKVKIQIKKLEKKGIPEDVIFATIRQCEDIERGIYILNEHLFVVVPGNNIHDVAINYFYTLIYFDGEAEEAILNFFDFQKYGEHLLKKCQVVDIGNYFIGFVSEV